MKLNPIGWLLGGQKDKKPPVLLAVTPPRTGERTLLGVENLLQSIAVPEPFSLELAGDADGVTLMARCRDDEVVKGQISAHYPQARIQDVPHEEDPLRLDEGEEAWSMTRAADGPDYLPLRTFRDDDLLDPGSDPLIALIGALSTLHDKERIVARILLRSLGPDWSAAHMNKAVRNPATERRDASYTYQTKPLQTDAVLMIVLGLAALGVFQGYFWVQGGETWKAVLRAAGVALGTVVAGWGWWRWRRARSRVHDPLLIKEKVSRIAFGAELQVTAILPKDAKEPRRRANELLSRVAAAYRHYDNPAGARFRVGKVRPTVPVPSLQPASTGLFGKRSVLGVREMACLWHPPRARDETPLVERSGARVLLPSARGTRGGALVGQTTAGNPRDIHFPDDLLRRHHLYVARTRMGKSTLMHHIVSHKLNQKAEGKDPDAIVVVDPHTDLVSGLLGQVPESLVDQVRLIDLADDAGAPGINLLDTRIFADRDRTADSVVRVAKGLWDQWGPRMQSILEQTVKTLHEANEKVDADQQYTILDGLRLLSDDKFQAKVLAKVSDPYLLEWWSRDFSNWHRQYKAEALAPVQTRLSYYASSKKARAILGQSRSTIDMRQLILDGGVLLVSTSQGTAGRDVAALVGASILNLVDAVIREQGALPLEKRRGVLVVVDEMQSMLSELGKFGASFILATQGLAKLGDLSRTTQGLAKLGDLSRTTQGLAKLGDLSRTTQGLAKLGDLSRTTQGLAKLGDLSRTMQDSIMSNVGCLAVFQVAGNDARTLVWELGKDRVSEDDITSLPVHNCYVRATVEKERLPVFSMAVRKPEAGDPEVAARIRAATGGYATPVKEIAAGQAESERLVEQYRAAIAALERGNKTPPSNGAAPKKRDKPSKRRNQRTKRDKAAGATETKKEQDAPEEEQGA